MSILNLKTIDVFLNCLISLYILREKRKFVQTIGFIQSHCDFIFIRSIYSIKPRKTNCVGDRGGVPRWRCHCRPLGRRCWSLQGNTKCSSLGNQRPCRRAIDGRDAGGRQNDHCLRYHHNFALFYQLLNSNFFTHSMFSFKREDSSETYGPRVYFPSYIFRSTKPKIQKYLADIYLPLLSFVLLFIFYIPYLYQISSLQVTVKGLTTPLSRWVQVFVCLCRCNHCWLLCSSYWIDTLVLKLREILISTLLHLPFLSKGKTNAISRSSRRNFWHRCRGGSTSNLPSFYHKLSSLAFTLFVICLSFSSPPLLKRFQKNTKLFSFFSFAFSFAFCLLVC